MMRADSTLLTTHCESAYQQNAWRLSTRVMPPRFRQSMAAHASWVWGRSAHATTIDNQVPIKGFFLLKIERDGVDATAGVPLSESLRPEIRGPKCTPQRALLYLRSSPVGIGRTFLHLLSHRQNWAIRSRHQIYRPTGTRGLPAFAAIGAVCFMQVVFALEDALVLDPNHSLFFGVGSSLTYPFLNRFPFFSSVFRCIIRQPIRLTDNIKSHIKSIYLHWVCFILL